MILKFKRAKSLFETLSDILKSERGATILGSALIGASFCSGIAIIATRKGVNQNENKGDS